jgi:hypothetical protein
VSSWQPSKAPRQADQSKIGVSRVPVPEKGEGNPGAGIRPVKIYKEWENAPSVVNRNKADAYPLTPNRSGPQRGAFDGGENKPDSDYLKAAAGKGA